MESFPFKSSVLAVVVLLSSLIVSCENPLKRGEKPWTGLWSPGDSVDDVGYKPDQPIPFNHNKHAVMNQMDCQYCHSGARRSAAAGVPPMNTCMGCHKFVKTDSPHIKYLTEKYNKNEPIEWTKVHDLPDFVRFSHQPHIQKFIEKGIGVQEDGSIDSKQLCASCHGDIAKMGTAEQVAPLQMGWCIDCHINPSKNIVESESQDAFRAAFSGDFENSGKMSVAPISCNTCHY